MNWLKDGSPFYLFTTRESVEFGRWNWNWKRVLWLNKTKTAFLTPNTQGGFSVEIKMTTEKNTKWQSLNMMEDLWCCGDISPLKALAGLLAYMVLWIPGSTTRFWFRICLPLPWSQSTKILQRNNYPMWTSKSTLKCLNEDKIKSPDLNPKKMAWADTTKDWEFCKNI